MEKLEQTYQMKVFLEFAIKRLLSYENYYIDQSKPMHTGIRDQMNDRELTKKPPAEAVDMILDSKTNKR